MIQGDDDVAVLFVALLDEAVSTAVIRLMHSAICCKLKWGSLAQLK